MKIILGGSDDIITIVRENIREEQVNIADVGLTPFCKPAAILQQLFWMTEKKCFTLSLATAPVEMPDNGLDLKVLLFGNWRQL